ncbi:hypothetical protein FRC19_003390 [Serendipita sp. 401]|nr:hypothetical protein FRC19_003390 [Serendipita sp. 401]KAG9021993.1 hypothetical protein FS842_006357 [Serendipita sp. 407]
MARQYLRTLPPSSTYNPSTDFMGVNSQILTQSELSSELQPLFSQPHQPETQWPLPLDTLFPSQPHQFSEQDSSPSFTLGSFDPEGFGTSLPQNSNELSWLN